MKSAKEKRLIAGILKEYFAQMKAYKEGQKANKTYEMVAALSAISTTCRIMGAVNWSLRRRMVTIRNSMTKTQGVYRIGMINEE